MSTHLDALDTPESTPPDDQDHPINNVALTEEFLLEPVHPGVEETRLEFITRLFGNDVAASTTFRYLMGKHDLTDKPRGFFRINAGMTDHVALEFLFLYAWHKSQEVSELKNAIQRMSQTTMTMEQVEIALEDSMKRGKDADPSSSE